MFARGLIIFILTALLSGDGRSQGRKGNKAYAEERYEAAVESYREGLSEASEHEASLRFGLLNNLASSYYRLEHPGEALEEFQEAARVAAAPSERAAARYNAGNAAFKMQNLEQALAQYRQALLENPDDLNAKFNYEFVKRRLQEQQQGEQQNSGQDPQGQQQEDQDEDQPSGEQEDQQPGDQEDDQQEDQTGQPGGEDEPPEQPQEPDEGQQTPDDRQTDDQNAQEHQPPPGSQQQLTQEEARRILQALENEEEKLLREVQRVNAPPRRVEKDW